jgi:hypothetical protein
MNQRSLFDPTIDARFTEFHRENPGVYALLVSLARQAKAVGKTRIGIKALWETMHWNVWLNTDEEPRFNNSYVSRYARLIVDNEPDIAPMIALRRLRAA